MTAKDEPADENKEESTPGSDSAEHLLRELEARMQAAPDPLAALAGVLGSRASRSATFTKQGTMIGDYRLDRVLGVGGMGVTYLGVSATGAEAAIKVVEAMAESVRERFARECQILQSLEHPAIVRYRGHGVLADGCAWLMMDLVPGTDLEALLDDLQSAAPRLPASATLLGETSSRGPVLLADPRYHRRILRLLAAVADALEAVHARGIVHRDLKPANILVTDTLDPVVIDFGLSRDAFQKVSLTRSGIALGTLAYMAPEQLDRDPGQVDRRADVYALGLVLYRALVGCDLRGETRDLVRNHRRPFVLATAVARSLPVPIQAILYRCLDPRPKHRYPTAAALAVDLRAAAGNEPVQARRPGFVVRHLRRPAGMVTRVAVVVAASSLLLWAMWPTPQAVLLVVVGAIGRFLGTIGDVPFDSNEGPRSLRRGEYTVSVQPENGAPQSRTVELVQECQSVILRVRPNLPPEGERGSHHQVLYDGTDAALVQITSGGTLRRDRWFVDDEELPRQTIFVWLKPEEHRFAVDAYETSTPSSRCLFREEVTMKLAPGSVTDLSLAPSVLADVPGDIRCTWATVLSPPPRGLSLDPGGAIEFMDSNIGGSEFDFGWSSACAFTAPMPRRSVEVVLRYEPELPRDPIRSAAAWLRSEHSDLESVRVEFRCRQADGGGKWIEWPHLDARRVKPRLELRVPQGFVAFEVRARWEQGRSPGNTAPVMHLLGTFGGGHIATDPCCFAFAGDVDLGPEPVAAEGWIVRPCGLAWRALEQSPKGRPRQVIEDIDLAPELVIRGTPGGPRLGGSLALLDLDRGEPAIAVADIPWHAADDTLLLILDPITRREIHRHRGKGTAQWRAAAVGDLNGDDVAEYAIADAFESTLQPHGGAVWLVCGKSGTPSPPYRLSPPGAGKDEDTQLGSSVLGAGDLDLNGKADVLVAARGCSTNGHHSGRIQALTFDRAANPRPALLYQILGMSAEDKLTVVAAGRDLNGDRTPDFVSWRQSGAKSNRAHGRLVAHCGKTGGDLLFDVMLRTGGHVVAAFGGMVDGGQALVVALAVERVRDRSWSPASGPGPGFLVAYRVSDGEWMWEIEADRGPVGSMVAIGDRDGDGWIDFAAGVADDRVRRGRGGLLFISGKNGVVLGRAHGPEGDELFGEQLAFSPSDPEVLLVGSHRPEERCGSVYRCRLPTWKK